MPAYAGMTGQEAEASHKFRAGESPSWLRQRILIPPFEGSNPSSPAINKKPPQKLSSAAVLFGGFCKVEVVVV